MLIEHTGWCVCGLPALNRAACTVLPIVVDRAPYNEQKNHVRRAHIICKLHMLRYGIITERIFVSDMNCARRFISILIFETLTAKPISVLLLLLLSSLFGRWLVCAAAE